MAVRKLHVAVLMGGWSSEREVSLVTGAGVADALESRGHRLTRTKTPSFDFGSSQIIWRFPDGGPYLGASESRRDGAAVGF